ncbi:MAG: DUF2723 domain-containing protein [Prevotellaceae bacterium]|jgi:hypothetical protein|nr:DUF2723 domain-containing protein [Prevotellaceae bacterium]
MLNFKRLNLIFGWLTFAIASVVYLLTIEPSVPFWDCGEFIASANKLLVCHPPGAPLFLMLGRLFILFHPSNAAMMVNVMSALSSSFTILFMFWSLTHIMAKLFRQKDGAHSAYDMIVIFGAAAVGSLAYTFSDTFWFSAVEGEVYAISSLFTALVFWAILKWESEADTTYANRWLVLIAYLMGLSIGVHLLNLLAIPAMVMVYYFKKYKTSTKGLIYASAISVIILGATLYGIIPLTWTIGSWFELLFVNSFGLPYNSGLLFFVVLLFAGLAHLIWRTYKNGKQLANIIALCVTVMLIGYGSYAMVLVRSAANPSMDQNNPDNVFSLMSYLNREQYGDRPLFKGQYFNAPQAYGEDGGAVYAALNGKYEVVDHKTKLVYDEKFTTIFPRMFSNGDGHADFYKTWNGGFKGKPVRTRNAATGENEVVYVPTFAENISFFLTYQVGYMYLRYFMWNFAGRQNDLQGHGESTKGNWISGIPFIDNSRLGGDQSLLPDSMKANKARNKYYMLPLILGLAGMFFQYKRSKKDFTVLALLFFFTGIAIVMYLNQNPIQPRERDYAYAASFYAFALWIGIGVAAVAEGLRKIISKPVIAGSVATVASLALVPCVMAKENWDDHNRSGRYLARDFAYNYLNSCKPNSVLFTYGDNDTFPLWYIQEVEGVRTDVRLMNLSYASAEWYIEQMQQAYYKSAPLPMSLTREKVAGSRRAIVAVQDRIKEPLDIKKAMDFVISDAPSTKGRSNYRGMESIDYFPSKTLRIETNVENALRAGIIEKEQAAVFRDKMDGRQERGVVTNMPDILPYVDINLGSTMYRNSLAIIDLLANFSWNRPIYWGTTAPASYNLGLDKYFKNEGFANLFVPQLLVPAGRMSGNDTYGYTNADSAYDKLMNVFVFRNLNNPKVYYDENSRRMMATERNAFIRCIIALVNEEKNDKAKALISKYLEAFPAPEISIYYDAATIVDVLYIVGENERANAVANGIATDAEQQLRYFRSLKRSPDADYEYSIALQYLRRMSQSAKRHNQVEQEKKLNDILSMYN